MRQALHTKAGLAALAAAFGLTACAPDAGQRTTKDPDPISESADIVDRGVPPLTGAEIAAYFKNSTLVHRGETRLWEVYLDEDGAMRGRSTVLKQEGGRETAFGSWEATDDGLFCRQWSNDWAGGERHCAEVFQRGNDYLFVERGGSPDGELETKRTRRAGNPENL